MTLENRKTIILILLAFAFSFAVRLIWVDQFSASESFKFNNEFMINTNDGYYYAEGARDILAGNLENTNDLSPKESAASVLTAFIAKILPLQFETILFYMPAFFGSLLVIPIILIGRTFEKLEVGFIAALVGSIAWSYYNRTMVGYYDTDLLNIVLPTFLLWSLIWAVQTKKDIYILIAGVDSIIYRWWYPQSYSLEFAFIGLIFIYIVYQYMKKEEFQTNLLLITFMLFAMVNLDGWIRFASIVLFFGLLQFKRDLILQYLYYIFGFAVVVFFVTGGFDPIWGQLKGYVFKDTIAAAKDGLGVHFFTVMQTIREAGQIPFETFANRISGHTISFILACGGYVWFAFRHKAMLLALPMVGLGFLALSGGLRFTVYAVPVMALGLGYLIYEVSKFVAEQFFKDKIANIARYAIMALLTIGVLTPNITHIIGYKVPTVFTNQEVKLLDQLKIKASREDYVVTWWDYGYPIRYYSDVKTLVDGGKHSGAVNFPVSFALTNPSDAAAKLARLDVEYTEKRFAINENNKELDINHTNYIKWASSNIEQMTIDYGYKDTNNFLTALQTDIKLPAKTRDIYFYLPNRMMNIFPTVNLFSNLDLMTGNKYARPLFYTSTRFKNVGANIDLGNNIQIIKNTGEIQLGNQKVKLNSFITTTYKNDGKLNVHNQTINSSSKYYVIYMRNYNQFLVLDSKMYESLYIQLFVLENYDKNLFEPIIMDPMAKIFKLKI